MRQLQDQQVSCDAKDLDMANTNDHFVCGFIDDALYELHGGSCSQIETQISQQSVTAILKCLQWRHKYRISEISFLHFPAQLYHAQIFSATPRTRDGDVFVYVRGRAYKQVAGCTKPLVLLILAGLEHILRESGGDTRIRMVLDARGCGWASFDLQLIVKALPIVLYMYPGRMAGLYAYELPWLIHGPTKLAIRLLPTKFQSLVNIVTRKDMLDRFDGDVLPLELGGSVQSKGLLDPIPNDLPSMEWLARKYNISDKSLALMRDYLAKAASELGKEDENNNHFSSK